MSIFGIKKLIVGGGRSEEAVKNIILSTFSKGLSILCSFLIVPLTIGYLDTTRYGIWLTLSSISAWINYLDLGIANGFRNRYAEAKAKGDSVLCRQYLSTAYFAVSAIVVVVLVLFFVVNNHLDWPRILNLADADKTELRFVMMVVGGFTCLNLVTSLFSTLLTADQKPGVSSLIQAAGQCVSLAVIIVLSKTTAGSLSKLAMYYSGIPCLAMLIASVIGFSCTRYRSIAPGFAYVRKDKIKDIVGLGLKMFIICVAMVVIFQVSNIILTRELGPEAVTEYNLAYKYYNILYMAMIIVITPFWSAFTDAYTQKDIKWMKSTVVKLERVFLLFLAGALVMFLLSGFVYRIWIGDAAHVSVSTSLALLLFVLSQILANIYMYLINGIGTVRIQLLIYVSVALVAWPVMTFLCRKFGIWGIVLLPSFTYLLQAVLNRIQLTKLLEGKATGWWNK